MEPNTSLNTSQTDESDMDKMIRYIFASCESKDKVSVSHLIEFIKPYMKDNFDAAESLKESLDPLNTDPEVSLETFSVAMALWAKKFNQEDSFQNISPSDLAEVPLVESTPRKSFGNRQQRVYAEAAALDISVVDSQSVCTDCAAEKLLYEDRIQELVHHNKRFQDELAIVKAQLTLQEEQNESLQAEFDKLGKQLRYERGLNETLIKETQQFEEIRDNSLHREKQLDKLQKQVAQVEREKILLEDKLNNAENDRRQMEEKLHHMHMKLTASRKDVQELQVEIIAKEEQAVKVKEEQVLLVQQITEQEQVIEQMKEKNDYLAVSKEKVTKIFRENMRRHSHGGPLRSMNNSHMNKSLPNMYIIERSNERKLARDTCSSYEGTTGDEDLLRFNVDTEFIDGYQVSLQDELSALPSAVQPPPPPPIPPVCERCKDYDELRDHINELTEQVDTYKGATERLIYCEGRMQQLQFRNRDLEDKAAEYSSDIQELRRQIKDYKDLEEGVAILEHEFEGTKKIVARYAREAETHKRNSSVWIKQLDQVENLNATLEDRITELKDDNQRLKEIEKCLKVNISNLAADKVKIIEMNNLQIEEINADVEHLRNELQETSEQCNSLRLSNEDLRNINTSMNSKLENEIARFTEFKEEHDKFITIINSASNESVSTLQKLELLAKAVQAYEDLKVKNDALVEECNKLRVTQKKTPSHERSQIQLSKLRERNEYLDELLNHERSKLATIEEQLQQEQHCSETLNKDKFDLLKRIDVLNRIETSALALEVDIKQLSNTFSKLKLTMSCLFKKWTSISNQVPSLDLLLDSLADVPNKDQSSRIKVEQMNNEVAIIIRILESLINHNFELSVNDNKDSTLHILQSVSTQSSNSATTLIDKSETDIAEMTTNTDMDTLSNYSDEIDPFDDLHNIYLSENLEGLLRNAKTNDSSPLKVETFQIEEFALTFMVENNSIKKRLREKFNELQDVTSQIADQCRALVSLEKDCKKEGRLMNVLNVIVKKINLLSKLAEQFGGLQMEIKHSRILNILLSHIAQLNQQFDSPEPTLSKCTKPQLSSKLVYSEWNSCMFNCNHNMPMPIPCSSSRFQAALHKLRPFSFLMVGALTFALIAYIILYFMSDEQGSANLPVCWMSWFDNTASLVKRKYTNGIPPT